MCRSRETPVSRWVRLCHAVRHFSNRAARSFVVERTNYWPWRWPKLMFRSCSLGKPRFTRRCRACWPEKRVASNLWDSRSRDCPGYGAAGDHSECAQIGTHMRCSGHVDQRAQHRNSFPHPLKVTPAPSFEVLTHPGWRLGSIFRMGDFHISATFDPTPSRTLLHRRSPNSPALSPRRRDRLGTSLEYTAYLAAASPGEREHPSDHAGAPSGSEPTRDRVELWWP